MMYTPRQFGIDDDFYGAVVYEICSPGVSARDVTMTYWRLCSARPLDRGFTYHVLPDACVDIVFNARQADDVVIMTPGTSPEMIDLGTEFDYYGIRLAVGSWSQPSKVIGKSVAAQDIDGFPTASIDSFEQPGEVCAYLDFFVEQLKQAGIVRDNPLMRSLLIHTGDIQSVGDMARLSGYSSRQLQRLIVEQTGYSPHDLLKIIRFQRTLGQRNDASYSDQSHYIHSFKQHTGYKPTAFMRSYSKIMSDKSNP